MTRDYAKDASAGRARVAMRAAARAERRPFKMWEITSDDVTRMLGDIRNLCEAQGIPFEAAVYDSAPPIRSEHETVA